MQTAQIMWRLSSIVHFFFSFVKLNSAALHVQYRLTEVQELGLYGEFDIYLFSIVSDCLEYLNKRSLKTDHLLYTVSLTYRFHFRQIETCLLVSLRKIMYY